MPHPQAVDLEAESRQAHKGPFLRSILNGLIYDGYRFPTEGNDGVIGPFTISKAMPLYLRRKEGGSWSSTLHDPLGLLAAHLNFKIVPGQITGRQCRLTIGLALLHCTVRRRKCQLSIDDDGPSGITAAQSIHMNQNNTWRSRVANLRNLATALETEDRVVFTPDQIVEYLEQYEGLTDRYMRRAASGLKEAIEKTIHTNAGGGIEVAFTEDAAWSGRDGGAAS